MDAPTDAQLIVASLDEPRAFAGIFDRHFLRVRNYLWRRVESSVAAELSSETFTIAFDARARYDPSRADAGPWLLGIATNLLRRHRRGEVRRLRALAAVAPEPGEDDAAAVIASRVDAEALRGPLFIALLELSPADRDALLLLAWADLSYLEIASALEVPIGTVRSRIHRARMRLQGRLGPTGRPLTLDAATLDEVL
jgi:RNA polymerase sigma-70 factor (ECF subfamily)